MILNKEDEFLSNLPGLSQALGGDPGAGGKPEAWNAARLGRTLPKPV